MKKEEDSVRSNITRECVGQGSMKSGEEPGWRFDDLRGQVDC